MAHACTRVPVRTTPDLAGIAQINLVLHRYYNTKDRNTASSRAISPPLLIAKALTVEEEGSKKKLFTQVWLVKIRPSVAESKCGTFSSIISEKNFQMMRLGSYCSVVKMDEEKSADSLALFARVPKAK